MQPLSYRELRADIAIESRNPLTGLSGLQLEGPECGKRPVEGIVAIPLRG